MGFRRVLFRSYKALGNISGARACSSAHRCNDGGSFLHQNPREIYACETRTKFRCTLVGIPYMQNACSSSKPAALFVSRPDTYSAALVYSHHKIEEAVVAPNNLAYEFIGEEHEEVLAENSLPVPDPVEPHAI